MKGRRTVGAARYWPMQESSHHENKLLQWNFVAVCKGRVGCGGLSCLFCRDQASCLTMRGTDSIDMSAVFTKYTARMSMELRSMFSAKPYDKEMLYNAAG